MSGSRKILQVSLAGPVSVKDPSLVGEFSGTLFLTIPSLTLQWVSVRTSKRPLDSLVCYLECSAPWDRSTVSWQRSEGGPLTVHQMSRSHTWWTSPCARSSECRSWYALLGWQWRGQWLTSRIFFLSVAHVTSKSGENFEKKQYLYSLKRNKWACWSTRPDSKNIRFSAVLQWEYLETEVDMRSYGFNFTVENLQ